MQFFAKLFILLIPVALFLFYLPQTKKPVPALLANIYLVLIIGITLLGFGERIYAYSQQPPKWDFLGFWLNGKAGISGENFYDGDTYRAIALPYEPGDEFRAEIIDTGFWYPPFTMFLFLPLGLFDLSTAYLLWQILNFLVFFACVSSLWKLFLVDHGILGLLLVGALMIRLEPTRSTFNFGQTNLLTLLFFLLFWKNRTKPWGGAWLAFCVVVKPYMAFLYMYPLLTKNWRMLFVAISTLLILTVLSILSFGSDVFMSFLHNPVPETPHWNYTQPTNQSLLATILRSGQGQILQNSPVLNPWYLGLSLLLTLITALVTIKNNNADEWKILSILFLALIVYPANQMYYSVFLIVPVVLLLQQAGRKPGKQAAILFIVTVAYFLSAFDFPNYVFFANLFMWLTCIIFGASSSLEKLLGSDPVTAPAMSIDSPGSDK